MGRADPLTAYGPAGFKAMPESIIKAWQIDIDARAQRLQHADVYRVDACEFTAGTIYRDHNITITLFPVHHQKAE
ncbi:MAG: hypothetical protein K2Z80_22510 [Xanthobacteraceae bacterium]|nr:hypothetical protein [Xanthobacteraceae bacterium]